TLGIVGLGTIGQKVARLARAFGMRVQYYDIARLTEDQEDALGVRFRLLREGRTFGAGLDVFDREPPPANNPLLKLDNVVLTAHFAGPTWDNHVARFRNAFDNVQRIARGEAPLWVVPELAG